MTSENSLNANLAEILRKALNPQKLKHGIRVGTEIPFKYDTGAKRNADLVCFEVQGYTIGIEAKRGWGIKLNANKQASIAQADELVVNKAKKHFCDGALAIIYPDKYENQDDLEGGKVQVAERTPFRIRKKKPPEWKVYAVKDLPKLIRSLPSQLGQPEDLAKRAEIAVNDAFKKFDKKDVQYIMRDFVDIIRDAGEAAKATNLKGLLVDLLTCFMFHTKLDETPFRISKFPQKSQPPKVRDCIDSEDPIAGFIDAYDKWLEIDYTDILDWNIAILKALPNRPRSVDVVKNLATTAQSIHRQKGAHHHDVVGITFCNAIEAAKQEGAMYTTLPAATLLTHLLFHKSKINWKNLEEIKQLRIVDFACGSGTLLIAAANYILQKEKTGNRKEVSRALIEKMLYGFDCNSRAIFQTATGLGMISPSVKFKRTQLRSMVLGVPKEIKEGRLGSLELLVEKDELFYNPPLGQGVDRKTEPVKNDTFHFAIMNPPYSRMAIRHKQKKKEVEKKLREREQYLRKINPAMSAAGNSTAFFALVDKYIDPKTGKAGLVAPAMIASGETGKDFRVWLPKHFHIQYIIVSYDPKRIFFSGFTNIGEMLLVLERKKKTPTATKVIKLTENPDTEWDGIHCADKILDGEDDERWEVDKISPANMAKGDWSATQFLSNDLYRIAKEEVPKYWTSSFKKQINILHRTQIIIGAQKCHPGKLHATPCLWYHNIKYCDKMEIQPDCHVKPKKTNPEVLKFLENPSRLKIAWRINFPTIKNFACRTTVPSVSASWATIEVAKKITKVDEETVEKAVCILLNSTPAKLGAILARTNKKPAYVHLGNVKLNRIPMPLLSGMKPSAFRALAKVYDEQKGNKRKRLPQAHECPVQIVIDKAVCKYTGFPEKLCRQARHLLAHEPMVTGQRYKTNPEETDPELF